MLDWIVGHWESIFAWIGVAVTTCTSVVKLTPTKKDDSVVGKIVKLADVLSVVNTPTNKAILASAAKKKK